MPPTPPTRPRPMWGPDAATAAAVMLTVVVLWGAMKLLSIWAWVVMPGEYGDTYYYFLSAQSAATGGGIATAMREYPTPAGLLLLAPYEFGSTHHASYRSAILWITSVTDGAFAALLGRRLGPVPVLAWIAVTTSLGQLALLRFDILPAVVAGAAVLFALQRRPKVAAVLLALGAGLKLWPIVLLPLILDRHDRRRSATALGLFAGVGLTLAAFSLALAGWDRLVSPLEYQGERGLQIEAVAATAAMAQWAGDEAYRVWYSTFHAYEVTGPSVAMWLTIAQGASVAGALGCAVLLAWWWLRGGRPQALAWLALSLVGTFVVTSRALSPQYLLWLAAPAVAALAVAWAGGHEAPPPLRTLLTFVGTLVLCVLTTAIYPVYYGGITGRGAETERALALLTLRNVGLVALVAWSAWCAVRASRQPDGTVSHPSTGAGSST
ncbi:MAG: glycosyltransferase 87 family protein [Actinomycetes bacterium]